MELYSIYPVDFDSYAGASGEHTTVEVLYAKMIAEVDPAALKAGMAEALKRFPNFRRKIVLKDEVLYYAENTEEPILFEDDGESKRFGADTNHYLFILSYHGSDIRMRVHHGITDGRGVLSFFQTVCYYYLQACGYEIDAEDMVRTNTDVPDPLESVDVVQNFADPSVKKLGYQLPRGGFPIPETNVWKKDPCARRFQLTVPISSLLKISKKNEATPVPVMSIFIAKAFREVYETGESSIMGFIPVDLRQYFPSKALHNSSYFVPLPHKYMTSKLPIDVQATIQRGTLDLQAQKENFQNRIAGLNSMQEKFDAQPGTYAQKQTMTAEAMSTRSARNYSYLLTYPGAVRFPKSMDRHILSVTVHVPSFAIPFSITAVEYGGILYMEVAQNFADDQLVKTLFSNLDQLIPGCRFYDLGIECYDVLMPEDIEVV